MTFYEWMKHRQDEINEAEQRIISWGNEITDCVIKFWEEVEGV